MKVIGHRGVPTLAPENTFASFNLAIKLGVDALETDIQRTKDGKLVLFHDDLIERTTNGKGRIQDQYWHDLKELSAGSWFSRKYEKEKIPLLSVALQKYGKIIPFEIEIKQIGIENDVLKMIEKYHLLQQCVITSFDFQTIVNVKKKYPHIFVGYLTSDISKNNLKRILKAKIQQFCPQGILINKELVNFCHAKGLLVRAWGITNEKIMIQSIQAGVDGMTVDFPQLLLKRLKNNERRRS